MIMEIDDSRSSQEGQSCRSSLSLLSNVVVVAVVVVVVVVVVLLLAWLLDALKLMEIDSRSASGLFLTFYLATNTIIVIIL